MYNVFSTSSSSTTARPDGSDNDEAPRAKKARKEEQESKKLTRSCAECRRRRIRCDSTDPPCGQCTWYKVPSLCHYPTRRKRNVPSQEYAGFSPPNVNLTRHAKLLLDLLLPSQHNWKRRIESSRTCFPLSRLWTHCLHQPETSS